MEVRFMWPLASAGDVKLAGSFNDWKPVQMNKDQMGWTHSCNLAPGRYEFKFVVDGQWMHDEHQDYFRNEMGSYNNVIQVPEAAASPVAGGKVDHLDEDWEVVTRGEMLTVEAEAEAMQLMSPNGSIVTEIERKFIVPEDYRERLIKLGFISVKEFDEILVDEYFDTVEHQLMQSDFWLRKRNGDWELKYPVGVGHSGNGSTLYHETSNQEDIWSRIRGIVTGVSLWDTEPNTPQSVDLNHLLTDQTIQSFAKLKTVRKCFKKDDVNIVIDSTDWGYKVGEIEMMLSNQDSLVEASKKIDDLAKQLNFAEMDLRQLSQQMCANSG